MLKTIYIKYLIILLLIFVNFNSYAYKIENLEFIKLKDKIGFYDDQGKQHLLEEYENEVILLFFWAKWCPPCGRALADLDELQKDLRKLPFKIIPISQDYQRLSAIKELFNLHKINNFQIFFDLQNRLMQSLSVTAIPTAILINQRSQIVVKFTGIINWRDEQIKDIILSHFKENDLNLKDGNY